MGILHSVRHFFSIPGSGRAGINYLETLSWSLNEWYLWGLLSLIIVWVSRKIVFRQKSWHISVIVHIVAALVVGSLHVILFTLIGRAVSLYFREPYPILPCIGIFAGPLGIRLFYSMLVYSLIAFVIYALNFYRHSQRQEERAIRSEAKLIQAQLEALKMQLHPHFLFNTLNAITALVRESPDAAENMITRLSDLLRTTLDSEGIQKVSLRQELEFLDRYLDIQQVRFENNLCINKSIAPEVLDALVPSLILQPLAENAFRHGITKQIGTGELLLDISLRDKFIIIKISNTGPKIEGQIAIDRKEGRGLANTRERLKQLYGDKGSLVLEARQGGGATVTVTIPFEKE